MTDEPKGLSASPLRHRLFLAVWIASISTGFGLQLQMVSAAWAMTIMTHSPKMVTLVMFVSNAPLLLFSMVFGAFSDLHDRRKIIGLAHALMFFSSASLALLAYFESLQPPLLLILTFILGCGFALYMPSWQASVRELVPDGELSAAISMNAIGTNFARIAGPALGGAVIAIGGLKVGFTLNAFTFLPMLFILWSWSRMQYDAERSDESLFSAIGSGLRFTFHSGVFSRIVVRSALGSACYIALTSLLPLVVAQVLDADADTYGMLLSCMGIGALIAVLFGSQLTERFEPEILLRASHLAMGLGIVVISLSTKLWLTGTMMVIFGAGSAVMMLTFTVCMQLSVPGWVIGRAMSVFQMGAFGGLALGALLWGLVADDIGVINALLLDALAITLVVLVLGWLKPLKRPNPDTTKPAETQVEPPSFGQDQRQQPVEVSCQYQIDEQDESRFHELMREWRKIRLSRGVRNWTLKRDEEQPQIWWERFTRPTAAEIVRQYSRRTAREEQITRELRLLHRGEDPPTPIFKLKEDS